MLDASEFIGVLLGSRRRPLVVGESFKWSMVAVELAVILGCSLASGITYHLFAYGETGRVPTFGEIGLLVALCFLLVQNTKSRYDPRNIATGRTILKSVALDWTAAWALLLTCAFLTKTTAVYSRGALVLFFVSGWICVTLVHLMAALVVRRGYRQGWLAASRIQIVGTAARIRKFQERLGSGDHGVEVAGVCILPNGPCATSREEFDAVLKGAVRHARELRVDDVLCLVPWADELLVERCASAFLSLPASVHLGAEDALERFSDMRVAKLGTTLCLELARAPLSLAKRLAKRLLDLVLATAASLVLWPLLLLVAVTIKLDSPGPVLFLQRRYGFNNEVFRIVKFRTMAAADDGPRVQQATRDDARVTRVGRFLRRWNLDELPQLLNVIAGSMSIVGPRPHAMSHNHEFERKIALYARRHNVKPGITGWAQVNGFRGITDTEDKIRNRVIHDLFYIDNWSLSFDFYIMALTVLSSRAYRNAY